MKRLTHRLAKVVRADHEPRHCRGATAATATDAATAAAAIAAVGAARKRLEMGHGTGALPSAPLAPRRRVVVPAALALLALELREHGLGGPRVGARD